MTFNNDKKVEEVNVVKLGLFIRKLRIEKGMKQSDLARVLGIDSSTISKWENGNFAPDLFRIRDVAKALGISSDELLSLKVNNKKDKNNKEDMRNKLFLSHIFIVLFLLLSFIVVMAIINKDDNKYTNYYAIIDNCDELDFEGNIVENDEKIVVSISNLSYQEADSRTKDEKLVNSVTFIFYMEDVKVYELNLTNVDNKLSEVLKNYNLSFEFRNKDYDLKKFKFVINYVNQDGKISKIFALFEIKNVG